MKYSLLILLVATNCFARGAGIYSKDGEFLGNLNQNDLDPKSVYSEFGTHGNSMNPNSIKNTFGIYGNPLSPESTKNMLFTPDESDNDTDAKIPSF